MNKTRPSAFDAAKVLKWTILGLLWAALCTPLIVTPATLFPFQTGKGIVFRTLVELAGFFYLWLCILEPKARPKRNPVFWSIVAYAGVLLVTTVASIHPYRSFWGDLERMEGVFGIFHGIALFIILGGLLKEKEDWARLFGVSLLVSFFVAWYAFAQIEPALRLFPVVEPSSAQPGSTIGHQSFLATYAIFQIAFGLFIVLLRKSRAWKVFGVSGFVVNLILLSVTAVRGAQLGVLLAGTVGIALTAVHVVKNVKTRIALGGAFLIVIAFFVSILSLKDSPHLKKFPLALQRMATISPDAAMARTRLIALRVSWEAFKERPILGWGQENFKIAYNRHFDPEHLYYEGAWFDRAHNKIAEVMVQTGGTGLIAYGSIFVFSLLGLIRFVRARESSTEKLLAIGAIMLGAAYFVQNLFLFDMQTSYLMFFSSLAFVTFLLNGNPQDAVVQVIKSPRASRVTMGRSRGRLLLAGGGILTACLVVYSNWIPYTTARLGRTAYDASTPSQAMAIVEHITESGGFPEAEAAAAMMEALISSGKSKHREWANVVPRIERYFSAIIPLESADPRILIQLGKLYNDRALTDPTYLAKAERVLRNAIALAPARPEGYQELGVTRLQRGEEERALQLFREALALNERNARARWVLGLALASQKKYREGIIELEKAISDGYNWDTPVDIGNLGFVYHSMNLTDRLAQLYELAVERHPENADYRIALAKVRGMTRKAAGRGENDGGISGNGAAALSTVP